MKPFKAKKSSRLLFLKGLDEAIKKNLGSDIAIRCASMEHSGVCSEEGEVTKEEGLKSRLLTTTWSENVKVNYLRHARV